MTSRVFQRRARRLSLWAVAMAASTAALAQTPAPGLTLDAAIARALETNRSIAAARLARPVNVAGVAVARERPNPDVAYDAEKETPRQSITMTLPLELGGKRDRRIDLAQAVVASGDAELAQTIATVGNAVRRAYFAVLAADEQLAEANAVLALATRARDAAATRYSAGDVPLQDTRQTTIAFVDAQNGVTAAEGERVGARAELNVLLGQPADAPLTLTDSLIGGAIPSLAEAVAAATASNVDLALLDRRIAEQTARRDLAKALQTPDLSVGGAFTYDAMPDFRVGWRASVDMTVPLFTKHRAGVVVEDSELVRLRAERDARAAEISGAVAASLARATSARAQVTRYQTDILPALAEVEQMAQDGYSAGQTNLVALLEVLRQTRETRQRGLDAALAYQQALADLEQAMGTRLR